MSEDDKPIPDELRDPINQTIKDSTFFLQEQEASTDNTISIVPNNIEDNSSSLNDLTQLPESNSFMIQENFDSSKVSDQVDNIEQSHLEQIKDEVQREWMTLRDLSLILGISLNKLRPYLHDVTRNNKGLFNVSEVLNNSDLQHYLSLPQEDPDSGICTVGDKKWVNKSQLARNLGISINFLNKYLDDIGYIQAKDSEGRATKFYDEEQLQSNEELTHYLALPQENKEEGACIIDGERWISRKKLIRKLKIHQRNLDEFLRETSYKPGRDTVGKQISFYRESEVLANEELKKFLSLPREDESNGCIVEGERYVGLTRLSKSHGIDRGKLKEFLKTIKSIVGRDVGGRETLYYAESELLANEELKNYLNLPREDKDIGACIIEGERWATLASLSKRLGISHASLKLMLSSIPTRSARDSHGRETIFYHESEALLNEQVNHFLSLPSIDPEENAVIVENKRWVSRRYLSIKLGVSQTSLEKYLSNILFIEGRSSKGKRIPLYDEAAVLALSNIQDILNLPQVDRSNEAAIIDGERWVTVNYLEKKTGVYGKMSELLRNTSMIMGRTISGKETILYKESEVLQNEDIIRLQSLPRSEVNNNVILFDGKRWITINQLEKNIGISHSVLKGYTEGILSIVGKPKAGPPRSFYDESELLAKLEKEGYFIRRAQRENNDIDDETQTNLEKKAKDLAEGKTIEAQEFRKLLSIFGGGNTADILYRHYPQFKGLPVDYVNSVLSEYLGDFLVVKKPFNPPDLELAQQLLSDGNFQDDLHEVIKIRVLEEFNKKRNSEFIEDPERVINECIDTIYDQTQEFRNENLQVLLDRVKEYYRSLFHDLHKPEQFVDRLKEGRLFPDITQLINIKELSEKKRILIADEMGLGKSASMVLAKEMLGISTALIIAPSNVISTWQNYLSDKVGKDGRQIGYFKTGLAPRVLIIDSPKALQNSDFSQYDYVLLSQERLTSEYVTILENQEFGMVIVDEVHKLKNIKEGKRAQNLLRLASKVEGDDKYLALLSGTPAPNKVEDIAVILKLLYPHEYRFISNKSLVSQIIQGELFNLRSLLVPRMQRKGLTENVDLPKFTSEDIHIQLSDIEKQVYEVLLEEDELVVTEKLKLLRQFLMNPGMLDATPGLPSSKVEYVSKELKRDFGEHKVIAMFVNGYIEDIIRGDKAINTQLGLPEDVEVRVIEGNITQPQRNRLIEELKLKNKKTLLLVSGQTADVGIDLSFADGVYIYNEPWTSFERDQEIARVYREGVTHDIKSKTYIVDNTIEEGIHIYIEAKKKAIEKLLQGIPLSEIEQQLLIEGEKQIDSNLEVNPELAAYYFSSWDKMKRIFAYVRELGEEEFKRFLEQYGKDYADGYKEMGRRSYQSNACRVSGSLIYEMIHERGQAANEMTILDIASGPEMLRKHSHASLQNQIYSLDINPNHFADSTDDMHRVGSFLDLPFEDGSIDYANLSLALHYSSFVPSRGQLERMEVLMEANRVLKTGGRLVLNNINSLDIKSDESFKQIIELMGFRFIEDYSGDVSVGKNYQSKVITLEKIQYYPTELKTIVETIGKENYDGLRFKKNSSSLKDSRRIITEFYIGGRQIKIHLNDKDKVVLQEEQAFTKEAEDLKAKYGTIEAIPKEEIIKHNFVRILIGGKYILFKKLQTGSGVIVVK